MLRNYKNLSFIGRISSAILAIVVLTVSIISLPILSGYDPSVISGRDFGKTINRLPNQSLPLFNTFNVTGTFPQGLNIPNKIVYVKLTSVDVETRCFFNRNTRNYTCEGVLAGNREGYFGLEMKVDKNGAWQPTQWRVAIGNIAPQNDPSVNFGILNGPVTDLGKYLSCDQNGPVAKNSYINCSGLIGEDFVIPKSDVFVSFRTPGSNTVKCNFVGPVPFNVSCPNIFTGNLAGDFSLRVGFATGPFSSLVAQSYSIY
jgi:hypothetical protein